MTQRLIEGLVQHIDKLVAKATSFVPSFKHSSTHIYLMATAGIGSSVTLLYVAHVELFVLSQLNYSIVICTLSPKVLHVIVFQAEELFSFKQHHKSKQLLRHGWVFLPNLLSIEAV